MILTSYDASAKIKVIKAVKEITGLGLKEAKELVDNVPSTIKTNILRDEALSIKEEIEAAGGIVELTTGDKIIGGNENEEVDSKDKVDVILTSCDSSSKIPVIKAVREVTGMGIAEAKASVENAPSTIKTNVSIDEALSIKEKIEAAGGTVQLR